jgi:hypothetical protein
LKCRRPLLPVRAAPRRSFAGSGVAQTVYCSYADESWYFSAQIRRVAAATTVYIRSESCTACTCAVQGESRRRDSNLQRGREAEARARVFTAQIFTNATCMHACRRRPSRPPWLARQWMDRLHSDATEIRFPIGRRRELARSIDRTATAAAAGSYFPAPFMLAHAVPPLCASSSSCSSLLAALLVPCTCRQSCAAGLELPPVKLN